MSSELWEILLSRHVATIRTTAYHPKENSQCERLNSTLWKTVKLMLRTRNLQEEQWDQIIPDALHAIRSLLCTTTNQTPHERFLCFERRSMLGRTLPAWLLTPGTVLMKRFVRNKNNPLIDRVKVLTANPHLAFIHWLHSCVYLIAFLCLLHSLLAFWLIRSQSLTLSVVSIVYVAYLILLLSPWFLSWIKHT